MVSVKIVSKNNKNEMFDIFNDYMHELSEFDKTIRFDSYNNVIYQWFDAYFEEKERYPFYYMINDNIVSMAMVREMENMSYEIAEFYVKPEYRGNGVAMNFADAVVNMFMGRIYISTLYDNARAIRFWDKVAANYNNVEETGVEDKKHWVIVK